jgi:hypothetical protein
VPDRALQVRAEVERGAAIATHTLRIVSGSSRSISSSGILTAASKFKPSSQPGSIVTQATGSPLARPAGSLTRGRGFVVARP